MALIEYDNFHEPKVPAGARRCQYTMHGTGMFCDLLPEEHEVTPELAEQVIRALTRHPAAHVVTAAQDLGNEMALFDDKDWLVTTAAVITLRVENMAEEDAKPYFDDKVREQNLVRRLQDAIDPTDFYLTIDFSDTELEEALD